MAVKRMKFVVFWPHLAVVVMIFVCWFCCFRQVCWFRTCSHTATTVLAIRHAEKALDGGDDPPLSAAGQARAQEFVHVAEPSGVTAIYATQFIRTQQTVQQLATALSLPVNQYSASELAGLVAEIKTEHAGEVVVVAGHSNTIPGLIAQLGGAAMADISDHDYDNLYVVTIFRCGRINVVQLQYGVGT